MFIPTVLNVISASIIFLWESKSLKWTLYFPLYEGTLNCPDSLSIDTSRSIQVDEDSNLETQQEIFLISRQNLSSEKIALFKLEKDVEKKKIILVIFMMCRRSYNTVSTI